MPKIVSFDDVEERGVTDSSPGSSSLSSPKGALTIPGSGQFATNTGGVSIPRQRPVDTGYSRSVPTSGLNFGRGSLSENILLQGQDR